MKAIKNSKKGRVNRYLPPAVRRMYSEEEPIYYDGMLSEATVTAPKYEGPQIRRAFPGETDPVNANQSFIGVDKTSGLSALRNLGKLFGFGRSSLAKNFNLKGIQSAYNKQMSIPSGANMNISDDVWSGGTLYGKGAAMSKEEALNRIADFQKDLSPVPFTHTHGTSSDALAGIFNNKGLIPSSNLQKSRNLITGEYLEKQALAPYMFEKGQSTVSTASIANPSAAAQYALNYSKNAGSYPVVFGINPSVGSRSRMTIPFNSDIHGEAQFLDKIGFDEINNVFVPDAQKEAFIKFYGDKLGNIKVGSFDDYVNEAQSLAGRRKITGAQDYLYKKGGKVKLKYKK
jgi:hypothetical protein